MQGSLPEESLEGAATLLEGTEYRPRRLLGRGGIGVVFEVEHAFLGRAFALKVLQPHLNADSPYTDRMRVEAQILGRLNHPNAVEVIDFWISRDGRPCLLMELLRGRTLAAELKERQLLPVAEAVGLTIQALSALSAAHALGVVHRDVKPENLFLHRTSTSSRRLKVLDFGIARITSESGRAPSKAVIPTATGAFVGSPSFMSPEALNGERVDHRADQYSLALVLYLMIAGRGPFDLGSTTLALASSFCGEVPEELDAVLVRALQEDPERRFPSADDFLQALIPLAGAASSQWRARSRAPESA